MILAAFKKAGKAVATGNTQAELGIQSPHLPSAITRLGRFGYSLSALWITVTWYSAYVNVHTKAGSGPTLVLPGLNTKNGSGSPSRSDPAVPSFGAGGVNGSSSSGSSSSGGGGGPNSGGLGTLTGPTRLKIAKTALAMVGQSGFTYSQTRPMPRSILTRPFVGDCSAFATKCYQSAGAPDPNGENYNGSGYTGTMEAKGTAVKNPNPGDLAFWSNPDHVAVVTGKARGGGVEIVEFGYPPAPIKLTVAAENAYHQSFLGYRSYV